MCRLLKSLYGLKQAPRQRNAKLSEALIKCGFTQNQHYHSLFSRKTKLGMIIDLVYVDDILVTRDDLQQIMDTKEALHKAFKIKYLGELKYFLGIEIAKSQKGIVMHQRKYDLKLLADTGLTGAKPATTPIDSAIKLTNVAYDNHNNEIVNTRDVILTDKRQY